MSRVFWDDCLKVLQERIPSDKFNMWISPLQFFDVIDNEMILYGPNDVLLRTVSQFFIETIREVVEKLWDGPAPAISLQLGSNEYAELAVRGVVRAPVSAPQTATGQAASLQPAFVKSSGVISHNSRLNPDYNFDTYVEGKSNQLAKAAALSVSGNPGDTYNPLFLYGGVGLGKTHLMQAIGNEIVRNNPQAKVVYLNSERFVGDMVKALQSNSMNDFKNYYRSLDALLIDDIQFFAGKDRSQEEFFYTFNALLEAENSQIVLTCDRYPKEINGLEERLKSRFGWGLTVSIEPPELETRVAILLSKAEQYGVNLPNEVAFFIADRIRSNVRELEGALKRVRATAHFTGKPITVEFAKEALRDLITLQDKLVSVDNIIKTVAQYYKLKTSDLLSPRRNRSLARPRQMAMALAKELTNHSLPEIGESFGGRDHTTVLHAVRKIAELRPTSLDIQEDHTNLIRILTT